MLCYGAKICYREIPEVLLAFGNLHYLDANLSFVFNIFDDVILLLFNIFVNCQSSAGLNLALMNLGTCTHDLKIQGKDSARC